MHCLRLLRMMIVVICCNKGMLIIITCGQYILDMMIRNQQIIRLGDQSEEEPDPMPSQDHTSQDINAQSLQQQLSREDHTIFQSIEKYLEEHCCIKFLLFLIIILLIIAIYQEKGYLIKKQRTFKFFIEKIQKEKIKKELISQTQDKSGQYITPTNDLQTYQTNQKQQVNIQHITSQKSAQSMKMQSSSFQNNNVSSQLTRKSEQTDNRYASIEGITMSKIVQAARWRNLKNEDILMHSELSNEEESYYQQKYKISRYEELPFCVVVPTFNNIENNRHISNIQSIVMQNYHNYHIVVIDDASADGTGKQVREYLEMQTKIKLSNYSVIENHQNQGSSKNIRAAAFKNCKPEQILLIVDGDDQLIGRQVLKLYNAVYQETGAWIVYSNFFTEDGKLGYSKPFPDRIVEGNYYRKYPFVTSHLRSLYTQLLRNIKEEDLLGKDGNYLKAANDVSIMLPCLEMAHRRVIYIPELTYLYNQKTGINNHQMKLLEQKRNQRYIRQKKAYQQLDRLFEGNNTKTVYNDNDGLQADPLMLQWFKQALRIKNATEDLGDFIDRFRHNL